MAAKNKSRKPRTWPPPPRDLAIGLAAVQQLIDEGRPEIALDEAIELARRYPSRPEPLPFQANLALDLGDVRSYHRALERLVRLEPNDPALSFSLVASYLRMVRPFLGFQALEQFLQEWPDTEEAKSAVELRADMAGTVSELLAELELGGASALEIAADHERVMLWSDLGDWEEARKSGEQLLRRKPDFIRGMNNLCQVYAALGQLPKAIELAHRVVALEPNNFHALGNLVKLSSISGRPDEARPWAERLQALPVSTVEIAIRQAEALSYLGDDAAVLAVAQASRELPPSPENAGLLPHLGAAAALRLGRENDAQELWNDALQQEPGMLLARANLEDLRNPPGERHTPWPFFLESWVPPSIVRGITEELVPVLGSEEGESIARACRRVLRKHPELVRLIPILLERGDPKGRVLALELAFSSHSPEMFAALRDFAAGPWGPDDQRMRAIQFLREVNELPTGAVRLWTRGELQELHLFGFEVIRGSRDVQLNPTVARLLVQAGRLGREARWKEALETIEAAIGLQPDAASQWCHLGNAQVMARDLEGAASSFQKAQELDPQSIPAVTGLAHLALERRDPDEADRLLHPLLQQPRIYQEDLGPLCSTHIALELARKRPEGARSWLQMWEGLAPDDPGIAAYRRKLAAIDL